MAGAAKKQDDQAKAELKLFPVLSADFVTVFPVMKAESDY